MTPQFDEVDPAAGTEHILVLTAGDGADQSRALAVVAAN